MGDTVQTDPHQMSSTPQRDGGASFLRGPTARIWAFTASIAVLATYVVVLAAELAPLAGAPISLEWWHLAVLFYIAEVSVVHFHFRGNAHSFSLSEIPLVLGLFLSAPAAIVAGQLVGTGLALTVNRRQPPIKLAFNLGQVALVGAATILLFRRVVPASDVVGPGSWAAVALATLVGLLIADLLIHMVIRISGGRLNGKQIAEVFTFSAVGAVSNALLGVVAVLLIWADPRNALLALVTPAVLYVAYRAYASQRRERSRLQAIYLATRRLHASPQIDQAVETAVGLAAEIFDAAAVEVILMAAEGGPFYRTSHADAHVEVMQPVDDESAQTWMALAVTGRRAVAVDDPAATVAGTRVSQALVAPLVVGHQPMGVVIVGDRLSDVDRYRREDEELLAALAGQLSVSLENGQLGDSLVAMTDLKEQLETEMEARDRFVASVSHELRTPLTAIMGLASELWDDHDRMPASEMGELLGMIAEQSAELSHIIEDLLVAARADAGNLVIKAETIDVAGEVRSVAEEVGRMCQRVITVAPGSTGISAHADGVRIRQIIRNLLTNAVRYGGDVIEVRIGEVDGQALVVVSDDGAGIPDDAIESVFEPYQRAHNASGTTASVGLGLSVARSLARMMGGDLVYRRRHRRSEFELTLPAAVEAPVEATARVEVVLR